MLENLNTTLQESFTGKIVRKELTKKIKEGANVPVYVLEYLLGIYCATDDKASIFQTSFHASPEEAVFKAHGVE